MKANIVTFHLANNYGAVLQAYALQQFLNDNFCETYILDYHSDLFNKLNSKPSLNDWTNNPKNSAFKFLQNAIYKGKNKKIENFRDNYLKLTPSYTKDNIFRASDQADVFITGSDQVWNYLIINQDKNYFLDFVNNKTTCSYAASFGVSTIPNSYIAFYFKNLRKLNYISTREIQGVNLVKDIINKDAYIMPDPTLLLDRTTWNNISYECTEDKKYILVYKITKADQLISFAKKLSKKTGLPIIYIPNDLKSGIVGKTITNVGPQDWIGYIKNAEYVVTNSFHGTVFSIIFNKKFFSEVSTKVNPSTSRIESLLKMFNLEKRTFDHYTEDMLYQELNSDKIQEIMIEQRKLAYDFFKEVFKNEK